MSIALACITLAWQAEAARFYRYLNSDGLMETSHTIPADRVPFGYDVLDGAMQVIEHVDPQLDPEELAIKHRLEREEAICIASKKRVRSLYESEADIKHAEEQALDSLGTRIANAQANLAQLRNQRRELEERAARIDRAGLSLTHSVLGDIDRAIAQIENLELEIVQRNLEIEETRHKHERDLVMFRRSGCLVASAEQIEVRG